MGIAPFIGSATPTPPAGAVLWLDASQITGVADGATLTDWGDSTGNGHDFNQTTGSGGVGPVYYKTTAGKLVNGRPAVWFAGFDKWLTTTSGNGLTTAQPLTIMVVTQITAFTSGEPQTFCCFQNNNDAFEIGCTASGAHWQIAGGGGTQAQSSGAADNNLHCFVSQFNGGSSSSLQIDGTTVASGVLGAGSMSGPNGVGNGRTGSSIASTTTGPMCEVLVYPNATVSLATLHAYAKSKWGTP